MKRDHRGWIVPIVILLLAAGLRLTRLGLAEFKYDEATTARSALAIVHEGQFPAMGMISSQGPGIQKASMRMTGPPCTTHPGQRNEPPTKPQAAHDTARALPGTVR